MEVSIASGELPMFGDFNLHVDDACDQSANTFLDLIPSVGLKQHILDDTHDQGHNFDLFITRSTEDIANNLEINDPALSDHNAVTNGDGDTTCPMVRRWNSQCDVFEEEAGDKWLNYKLTVDYMVYKQQYQQINSMLLESKYVDYNNKINEASGNQQESCTIF